ncbi:MAG: GlsB/YeaQ/YmgE family stress response membrane protein [Chloroflexi bacterium HGW-Chloroflexi-10]|nr:MAG: GlsB/YeaQ/YmgE family stress response membrane protein [Chloroflexi bacterium HGW-Chloroflexi-10]
MGFFSTIIVGLIAGLLASWLMKAKTGMLVDMILGIVGGVIGGWLSSLLFGVDLMSGLNLTSIITALVGAFIVIAIFRFFRRGK